MLKTFVAHFPFFIASLLLGACHGGEPIQKDYDDIAFAVAALVSGDVGGEKGSIEDGLKVVRGQMLPGISTSSPSMVVGLREGLRFEYIRNCTDGDGQIQSDCNNQTSSASLSVGWMGEYEKSDFRYKMLRSGEWHWDQLQESTAELNGVASFELDISFPSLLNGMMRHYTLNYSATYATIGVRTNDRRPISGEVAYLIDATRNSAPGDNQSVEAEYSLDLLVLFSDDAKATLLLDSEHSFYLDMENGQIVRNDQVVRIR